MAKSTVGAIYLSMVIAGYKERTVMAQQYTQRVYNIQGFYEDEWETVTAEETRKDALDQVACYRDNEPSTRFRIRSAYDIKPEYINDLQQTLERINAHYGQGTITLWDIDRSAAYIQKQNEGRWYTFTLLDDAVRFRGVERSINYKMR